MACAYTAREARANEEADKMNRTKKKNKIEWHEAEMLYQEEIKLIR